METDTPQWRGAALGAVLLAAGLMGPAMAQGPLSAIDWLSDTVRTPPNPTPRPAPPPKPEALSGSPVDTITTLSLDGPNPDATGLLSAQVTNLPPDLWAATKTDDLIGMLQATQTEALPALRDFFQMMLLAELAPPHDSDGSGRFLTARIDRLLDMAALDAAGAMLELAGAPTPEMFRRAFDVALLLGTEDAACTKLRENPGIAPTLPARIFCLARGGDWPAASLTFSTAQALGQLSAEDEAILERFLDPDLFEDEAPLPPPEKLSPLSLRLLEAIGEALPGSSLPLAFAHSELSAATGWKARIEAGERLARMGAITEGQLFALYTERMPAASGGVWARVDAVQRFDTAIAAGDPVAVGNALPRAYEAMQSIELEVPFGEHYAEALLRLPLTGEAAALALRVALISPSFAKAAQAFADLGPDMAFLRGLAEGKSVAVPLSDRMARSIAPVFAQTEAPLILPPNFEDLLREGAFGAAILQALDRINDGALNEPRAAAEGLAVLRRMGLEDLARRTALQLMILERRG